MVDGELAGQRFAVTDELTIGRENTDLILPDVDASRRHAVLRSSGARVEIEDLGSRNGTWVDGERVVGTVELSDGSRVRIGDTTLFVEVPRAQAPVTRVSAGAEAPPTVVPKGPAAGPTAPPATEATAPPVAPFSPPAPARARRPGVASRLWLPAGLTFATVIATAVALLVYFAAR